MEHDEIYEKLCHPEFAEIKEGQKAIIGILKGEGGDPGLCEKVRELEHMRGMTIKAGVFILGAVCLQLVGDVWGFIINLFKNSGP